MAMQLQLPLLLLLMMLVLFGASGYEGIMFGEDEDDTGSDFVVDDRLFVFCDGIDSEFLLQMRYVVNGRSKQVRDLRRYLLI
jgi:hypothetical protein